MEAFAGWDQIRTFSSVRLMIKLKFRIYFSDKILRTSATVHPYIFGKINMKLKFLLFSSILFFILGKHYHDELIFYYFSLQTFILFIAVFFHKREMKIIARYTEEKEPEEEPSDS